MFQQRRRIQLPVIGAILLCLLAGVYLFATRRSAKPDPASPIEHKVETSAADTLKYWTKSRMRKAKPVELPQVNGGKPGKHAKSSRADTSDNAD